MSIPEIEALASPATSTPWVPLWPLGGVSMGELAYAEITSIVTVSATTVGTAQVVVTAPAITCDGATPILIEFFAPGVAPPNIVGYFTQLWLFEDGVALGALATEMTPAAATQRGAVRVARRLTPTAGTHTYSIRTLVTSGNGFIYAGPGGAGADSPAFIRISLAAPISNAPAGALLPVQYGTSLPVSPVDGQEAILVDSLTAPTYQWRFRYNAGSSSAYKWEFVGGAPPRVASAASQSISSTSPVSFSPAVSATLARAGEYRVTISAQIDATGGSNNGHSQLRIGGGADAAYLSLRSTGTNQPNAGYRTIPVTVTAGQTVEYRASVEAATAINFNWATLEIIPARVA